MAHGLRMVCETEIKLAMTFRMLQHTCSEVTVLKCEIKTLKN